MFKKIFFVLLFITTNLLAGTTEQVKKEIELLLNKLPSSTRIGILIVNPLTQDTIFQLNPRASMIPASNTKLFTTAAAISLLSGNFKLTTKIYLGDKSINDGSVEGNLYIKGFGNSLFTSSDMDSLVDVIAGMGVKEIKGDVIGDDTYFDNIYSRKDWIENEVANVKLPPVSALVVDKNKKITYRKRRGRLRAYTVNITDPSINAAEILKNKLEQKGIVVKGKAKKGETPVNATMLAETVVLLRDLIKETNKHSDNFLAECLFKTIGAETSGKQGNSFYATQAVLGFIEDNGIFADGTSVVDGSGISRFDQKSLHQ